MTNEPIPNGRPHEELLVTDRFLDNPNEHSFSALFKVFFPQLVSFFRARSREFALAEDLAQEVMLTVYRKSGQIRDRYSFRGWLFKIAHNTLCRYYDGQARSVRTVQLVEAGEQLPTQDHSLPAGTLAFEVLHWIESLDSRESEMMKLKYIEQWEYHEIALAHG